MNLHIESECPSWTGLTADDVTVNRRNSFARGSREMGTGKVKSTRIFTQALEGLEYYYDARSSISPVL
jgi:hypothetical protein